MPREIVTLQSVYPSGRKVAIVIRCKNANVVGLADGSLRYKQVFRAPSTAQAFVSLSLVIYNLLQSCLIILHFLLINSLQRSL